MAAAGANEVPADRAAVDNAQKHTASCLSCCRRREHGLRAAGHGVASSPNMIVAPFSPSSFTVMLWTA